VEDRALVRHCLRVLAGERGELSVDGQWGNADGGPSLVDQGNELGLVGGGIVASGVGPTGHGHQH
jgi:hypothetical protein